ncbi:SBBP repeat-containing protein [Mechercharimyces sp. CAU 1602]|nr:SBBP repeat-containing protein [Mechercharimyces sp. CAU 1602]
MRGLHASPNANQFRELIYYDIWPSIDLSFSHENDQLKYTLTVHPTASPSHIRFHYEGANAIHLSSEGSLNVFTPHGLLREQKPISYQKQGDIRTTIPSSFHLHEDSTFGFHVDNYDQTVPLIIDPIVFYASYLGGRLNEDGTAITVDSAGNAYLTGNTSSSDFPVTSGAFQTIKGIVTPIQVFDAFITKVGANGASLVYSTFLGGRANDIGIDIALDSDDNAYVTGLTGSTDFPITSGAFQTRPSGCFVTKLNSTGSSLVYSTFLGGTGNLDIGNGITVNTMGNAYVTGTADSFNFPTTSGAFQTQRMLGGSDGFITKFSVDGSSLVYSTLLGGRGIDEATGIAIDDTENAYIFGQTTSFDFPVTSGAFQTSKAGAMDTFITKLNSTGSALIYSTYLGGTENDFSAGISLDGGNNAYVIGTTSSSNFPTTTNAFQDIFQGASDVFVSKLNMEGSSLVYSTFLGGSGRDRGRQIAVNSFGSAWVTGVTFSTNFPVTPDAFQDSRNGNSDAFITQISYSGQGITFSSYLGGSGAEEGNGIALDPVGDAYVTGCTSSQNFPVTFRVFQPRSGGDQDAFVAKIGEGQVGPTGATGPRGPRGPRGARGPRGNSSGEISS